MIDQKIDNHLLLIRVHDTNDAEGRSRSRKMKVKSEETTSYKIEYNLSS